MIPGPSCDLELRRRIEEVCDRRVVGRVQVFEDSSRYLAICGGSVLRLASGDYFISGDAHEGRFGIDDQPKFWVKYAVDLATGGRKIIKLVFHEQFTTSAAGIKIRCKRSPQKETAFLDAVRGHPRFMQGVTVTDPRGVPARVIDLIRGRSLYDHLLSLEMPHEAYFHEVLPDVMRELIPCIESMAEVHRMGLHHGDIRNDHIFIDGETGRYIWIDFDYEVNFSDYDVWSMGNIINFAVGRGIHSFHDLHYHPADYPQLESTLDEDDGLALQVNRIANLRKLFPYIPPELNEVLMRFSRGADDPYGDLESQVRDLRAIFADETVEG